jgi:hypothetical protein
VNGEFRIAKVRHDGIVIQTAAGELHVLVGWLDPEHNNGMVVR